MRARDDVGPLPKSIGPYEVVGILGQGGMGVVLEAVHRETNERLAIKTVRRHDSRLLGALRAEIIALKHVRHSGVVRILGEGLSETSPWYAMELIEGKTLSQLNASLWPDLARRETATTTTTRGVDTSSSPDPMRLTPHGRTGPLPPVAGGRLPEVLAVYRALCEPLSEIHAQALVHRDLKPSNVILRGEGDPVIMDFGLASRALGVASRDKLEGFEQLLGSLPYIAPEQLRREFVDARADLFSLGCMLYESLTGSVPFKGARMEDIVHAHQMRNVAPPSTLVEGVPAVLDRIVLSLLAGRPADRVGHADDLADALDALGSPPKKLPTNKASTSRLPYLYRPELVGRSQIVNDLKMLRERASEGHGSLTLIQGESGIGKTFLAAQVSRQAVLERFHVVTAECYTVAAGQPENESGARHLHLFVPLLQFVHDRCLEGGPSVSAKLLGPHGKVLAPFAPMLRMLAGQEGEAEAPSLPPEASQQRLFSALADVMGRLAAERPLMLVCDDLQWADELSLAFLASLPEDYFEGKNLVLLGLYRIGEIFPSLRALASRPYVTSIVLSRLAPAEIEAVIAGLLAMPSPPGWLTQFVHRHSEGNPFMASEYLRLAAAEGLLLRHAGRWTVKDQSSHHINEPFPVPGSIRELLAVRLQGLPERDKRVLQAAAVLGRVFEDRLLSTIAGLSEAEVDEAVRELVNRQLFERSSIAGHRFTHDKLREAAYAEIVAADRPALHQRAGRAIEARHAAQLVEPWTELAYHFKAAGDRTTATVYMERAANSARDQFANREAQHLFSELLVWGVVDGADAATKRAQWEHSLGEALHAQGALEEARLHLENAVRLWGTPFPQGKAGLLLATFAELLRQIFERLRHRVPRALRKADAAIRYLMPSRAYDRLLQIFYYSGLEQLMFYATLRTLNLAERGGPSPELARSYSIAHAVAGVIPVRWLADKYMSLAKDTLQAAYDREVDSYLQLLIGVYRSGTAEWPAAKDALDRGLALANELGFERRADEIKLGLTNWHILVGEYASAARNSDEVGSRAGADPQAEAWRLLMRAQIALVHGAVSEALALGRQAEQLVTTGRLARSEATWTHAILAAALMRSGAAAEAIGHVDRALAGIMAGRPLAFYCIDAYTFTAEVLIAAVRPGDAAAVQRAEQARAALRTFARVFPAARGRAERLAGDLARAEGREARALALWQASLATAQRHRMPPDEAEAAWRLARAPLATAAERQKHLAHALRIAEGIGAFGLATQIQGTIVHD